MTVNGEYEYGNSYVENEYLKWKKCSLFLFCENTFKIIIIYFTLVMHSHIGTAYHNILIKHILCE